MQHAQVSETNNARQRLFYIDVLRSVAIIGVIIIHGLDQILRFSNDFTSITWWYANILNSSVRWVLPAFFMISGLLLLSKDEDVRAFLTKRLNRIIVPTLVWSGVYGLWVWMQYNHGLTLKEHLISTFVHATPYYHLYFLFAIFGFYLLNPILAVFVRHSSQRRLAYAIATFLCVASVSNMSVSWFLGVYPGTRLMSLLQWVPFIGYYLAGFYFNAYPLTWPTKKIVSILLALITIAALGTYYLTSVYGHGPRGVLFQDYLSPGVIAVTLLTFALFSRLKLQAFPSWLHTITKELAAASFGIYLLHLIVMETLGKILVPILSSTSGMVANLLLIVGTLVFSYSFVKLGSFIPLIKKTIGY
jgi:surface polysaccharide O-acyltransferase-like enzyme